MTIVATSSEGRRKDPPPPHPPPPAPWQTFVLHTLFRLQSAYDTVVCVALRLCYTSGYKGLNMHTPLDPATSGWAVYAVQV